MPTAYNSEDVDPFTKIRVSNGQVILVVDDAPVNFTVIKNMLPEFYTILPARSGPEALEALGRTFVDLALLDIDMPGMSGIELFAKMQEHPDYRSIPSIFVTGEKDSSTIQRVIAMGAKDYILKPYDEKTLLSKVMRVLKESAADQAELFLLRKLRITVDACMRGDVEKAEAALSEVPNNVYSMYVFLKFKRILSALHNRDFNRAKECADEIIMGLRKR
ncbi:MAG: response regulator [Spirochaetaceae bacterium]|jgi:CheY-like chemotaxis protein|nr:response regulator [Spirochaetaceae bacterium]